MPPSTLRDIIAELGWTQRELARQIGWSDREVRRWCAGEHSVPDYVADWLMQRRTWARENPPPKPRHTTSREYGTP